MIIDTCVDNNIIASSFMLCIALIHLRGAPTLAVLSLATRHNFVSFQCLQIIGYTLNVCQLLIL